MKKQLFVLFTLAAISLISFTSCEPFIENKITIKNNSDASITLNIRAQEYVVQRGETLVLNDFKKGTFEYETNYGIPSYAESATIEGDFAGNIILNAGTEIEILYTYKTEAGAYTVLASMTSSDDVNRVDPFAVGGTP